MSCCYGYGSPARPEAGWERLIPLCEVSPHFGFTILERYCKDATRLYVRGNIQRERANSLGVISKTTETGPKVRFTFFEDPDGRTWKCDVSLNGATF